MLGKKVLFFVGRSYLVESAAYLSFDLMKNGFTTSIFCPFLNPKYKKSFKDIFYYFSLDNFFISFLGFPFFFFYLCLLVFKHDIIVIYQVKLSFIIRLWCIILRKKFYIIHSNAYFSYLDSLFSGYAEKIFYLYPTSNIPYDNAILSGLPLSERYKFSYLKVPEKELVITFFIEANKANNILIALEKLLSIEECSKIRVNILIDRKEIKFTDHFNINLYDEFYDYDLIKQSHIVICYPNSLILSKISAIGRPIFLLDMNKMHSNFVNFLELKGAYSGDIYLLKNKIRIYFERPNSFYNDCKLSSKAFYNCCVKDYL